MTAAAPAPEKIKVFFSYAHKDGETRAELEKYLKHLERNQTISVWSDRALIPGQNWDAEIKKELEAADLILLLLSVDFLNSKYIWETELANALRRHRQGRVRLIPILLRPLPEDSNPFAGIQGLPAGFVPIVKWENREEAFVSVADGIMSAVKDLAQSAAVARQVETTKAWRFRNPLFCNRDEQEFEFLNTCKMLLRARPGVPQVYVIRGEPLDRPDTLVERLYRGKIPGMVSARALEKKGSLYPKVLRTPERDLQWPDMGYMLADDLFQAAGLIDYRVAHDTEEANGSELAMAKDFQPFSFVVVRHDIDASKLGAKAGEFLKWYVNRFYAGLKGGPDLPQFLVFLNFIFREKAPIAQRWRLWGVAKSAPNLRNVVNAALESVFPRQVGAGHGDPPAVDRKMNFEPGASGCPCKLLKELTPLDQKHLQLWILESQPRPSETEAERRAESLFAELRTRAGEPIRLDTLDVWFREKERADEYQAV